MGTTLGKKEGVKSSVRTKKVVAVKRVLKKPTTKKVAETQTKTTPKSVTKKPRVQGKKQPETKATTSPEVVFVPSSASLRLLEKVQLYTVWYEHHIPTVMSGVAKVGGYAFIFIGALFAVFSYVDTDYLTTTPAALVCTEADCVNVSDDELPDSAPKISFLNSIPATLNADTDFKISVLNTVDPTIILTAVETGATVLLQPSEKLSDTEYRFMLPGGRLAAAAYTIAAVAEKQDSTYTFVGPTFIVPETELTTAPVAEVAAAVVAEELSTTTELATVDEVEVASTTATAEEEDDSDEEVVEEQTTVTTTGTLTPITIALHTDNQAEYLRITTGDFTPNKVEVYSQPDTSIQPLYLGQATLVQDEWVFSVSARSLPQTTHTLYASFVVAGKTYQSESVSYTPTVANTSFASTEADLAVLVQKIELALLASSVNNQNRQHYFDFFAATPESLFNSHDEQQFADASLLAAIDDAMRVDAESLQPLLLRYAAAIQAESDFMIALSSAALSSHYTKLASTIASTIAEPSAVPAIHTVLALRYQVIKDRIRESEDQIKQDTNNLTTKDSDQDGISDFDEVANFSTNPLLADTDNDGVLDSVELVHNSNPLAADVSLVPSLNKNIEEVTFDAVVEINFVGPEIVTTKDTDPGEYFVRVEGRSVPNSHVYLLSYSTGVVGVVKTGTTGLFSYTIERDFVLGEHEVAAVLVDAAGEIVASSKPHRFTRTQNALVAAAAMSTAANQNSVSSENNVILNLLVAAVGVITFGFILLLLSSTLRNRKIQKAKLA